jgi:hypothetical protein
MTFAMIEPRAKLFERGPRQSLFRGGESPACPPHSKTIDH